jgi:uncharacterized protein
MQYASGTMGRIFYLRFDHGEDLITNLHSFVKEHRIKSGMIHLIGALSQVHIVTGPRKAVLPPDQIWQTLDEAHELVGIAMIRTGPDGPSLHLHGSVGRERGALTGCIRSGAKVYIVIEAVITEFAGITITTMHDEKVGVDLPVPGQDSGK